MATNVVKSEKRMQEKVQLTGDFHTIDEPVASLTFRKLGSNNASINHGQSIVARQCCRWVRRLHADRWNRPRLCTEGVWTMKLLKNSQDSRSLVKA